MWLKDFLFCEMPFRDRIISVINGAVNYFKPVYYLRFVAINEQRGKVVFNLFVLNKARWKVRPLKASLPSPDIPTKSSPADDNVGEGGYLVRKGFERGNRHSPERPSQVQGQSTEKKLFGTGKNPSHPMRWSVGLTCLELGVGACVRVF
ncbi:hypothetical protein CEXT_183431 [Caerostris extrusa]|uniref:Uncharacterized protein n=1 Tax=Caerostris extrusa TaxID=172846 RepID=A0AAV4MNG3_CAEEX|nr:hypothetical protein CEXT_183431 [Caerostris extrusa]